MSVFAAVGITYLLRDGMLWWIYRQKRRRGYLEISLENCSFSELCDLLRCCSDLRDTFPGRALVKGVAFIHARGGEVSLRRAREVAKIFGIPVRKRRLKRSPRRFSIPPN